MPFVLHLLGLAVFAQGTSEFMLSGLVSDIAADMAVSVPAAGALTSAFAVGMIVGAPLMAVLSLRWPRRRALLGSLVTFLLVHVVGALTTSYGVLLATRFVGALANAGFLAVALTTATSLVAPDAKGRATSILLGGTTLACVVGVPGGALLGQLCGWRAAFWAVALISVPAVVAVARAVPPSEPGATPRTASSAAPTGARTASSAAPTGARAELRALRSPGLLVTLLLGALVNGATFCVFTYLEPLATHVSGIDDAWVPGLLALFGLGSSVGVALGGRLADTRPLPLLTGGAVALLAGWVVFALTAGNPVAAVALAFTQGMLSFAVGSTLISQALYAATGAPTLAGGFATAAFNLGAAVGPWAGGRAIAAGFGYRSPVWVGALLVASALVTAGAALLVRPRGQGRKASLDA
ncbi:Cmx/CmrA family chloramphenicol efflux MFS transporter [Streptomyces flavofungini]|uniref:Cmx/CmrA family chloramphenicol efflux MFS transporter n=1 Tax=Streptomyces flavofungini TaxID=68200 RepID=UPI0025B0877D|nr:Cmx/CmrA family chloramphenicol efflux MFS transporter [Streptomyces flavofungini]WJV45340.1 MFS transporter [Streptomyces flavofungini]